MCGIKNCKGHKNIPKTIFIQASPSSSSEDELEEEGISLPKPKKQPARARTSSSSSNTDEESEDEEEYSTDSMINQSPDLQDRLSSDSSPHEEHSSDQYFITSDNDYDKIGEKAIRQADPSRKGAHGHKDRNKKSNLEGSE